MLTLARPASALATCSCLGLSAVNDSGRDHIKMVLEDRVGCVDTFQTFVLR